MANYNVRIFGHRGVTQLPLILSKQFAADAPVQLVQPYEFSQTVALAVGGAAASSAADANKNTTVIMIEVPDGQSIRYEINPPGRGAVAGINSPSLSGKDIFEFQPGWTLSVIDKTSVP